MAFRLHNLRRRWQYVRLGINLLFLSTTYCVAQTDSVHIWVCNFPINPEFPGGFTALKDHLQKNLEYPTKAQKAGIKGNVFVSFVVETDGTLTNVNVLKGLGYGCDEEALRVMKTMPRWVPGRYADKPIRVKYNLPLLFGIDYPAITKTRSTDLIRN